MECFWSYLWVQIALPSHQDRLTIFFTSSELYKLSIPVEIHTTPIEDLNFFKTKDVPIRINILLIYFRGVNRFQLEQPK